MFAYLAGGGARKMSGWIKLHRDIFKNPWMRNVNVLGVWVYILLNVAYQPEDVVFEGKRITLQPGQGLFKMRQVAKELGISVTTLHRITDVFKSETQIETQTSPRNTLITVVNWSKYQVVGTQNETQTEHKRNTNGTQNDFLPITNKRIKEIKNKEKEKPEKTDFDLFWEAYPRKEGKGAARKSFEKAIKKGVTVDMLIDAVNRQRCGAQWTKDNGQYIPHPATWLNQERWEDELDFNGGSNGAAATTGKNMDRRTTGFESDVERFKGAVRTAQERQQANAMGTLPLGGDSSGEDLRTTVDKPWERHKV